MWRTLRVLANPSRLRVIECLFRDGPLCVSAVATRCRLQPVSATQHLRLLQSRGLIQARRTGRWVRYSADPDPLVAHAPPLTAALRHALLAEQAGTTRIVRELTAFTHERRILIVRAISRGTDTPEAIRTACRISAPALNRHLRKLTRRDVICRQDEHIQLLRPVNALARRLLALVRE